MTGRQIAALDLGSNSFHLKVARLLPHGGLQVVDRLREMVRLGAGLDPDSGLLDEAAQARALECLHRFAQRLRGLPPEAVRVVGTNTLRRARNATAFIAAAEAVLGYEIEVVAGREEARLIFLGVAASLSGDERRLVVDIGGGSTELIVGRGVVPEARESLPMGCVGWMRRLPAGAPDEGRWRQAVWAARALLEPFEGRFGAGAWERAVGASGTVRSVAKVLAALGEAPGVVTRAGLAELAARLLAEKDWAAPRLPGLEKARAPVFAGGVAVLTGVFEGLGIEAMEVADGALREGLLYELAGRLRGEEDPREASLRDLMTRYHVDQGQAQRVAETALALWRQAGAALGVEQARWGRELRWAAWCHEVGLDVAHGQYHKHGAYLLEHADLAGFSRQEQQRLAALVRLHRRRFDLEAVAPLAAGSREAVARLALLLRLAVCLHRGRRPLALAPESLRLTVAKRHLQLTFPPGWLAAHPLTRTDLEAEARRLAKAGWRLTFA